MFQAADKPHHIKVDYQFAQKKRLPCVKGAVAKRLRDCFLLNLCVLQSLRLVPRHLPEHKGGLENSQFVHFANNEFNIILCQQPERGFLAPLLLYVPPQHISLVILTFFYANLTPISFELLHKKGCKFLLKT